MIVACDKSDSSTVIRVEWSAYAPPLSDVRRRRLLPRGSASEVGDQEVESNNISFCSVRFSVTSLTHSLLQR